MDYIKAQNLKLLDIFMHDVDSVRIIYVFCVI